MRNVAWLVLLLALGCNDPVELSDRELSSDSNSSSGDLVAETLNNEVGPITIPFTLNKKNKKVEVLVAEGETRLLTMQMETGEEVEATRRAGV